jgi:hypothetical protein
VVTEYVLGAAGWIERLSLGPLLRALIGGRLYRQVDRYRVAWEDLDLAHPDAPRLRRRREDLERTPAGERRSRRRASA